jgi:16S rRNA (guanine(966)-N(2))-methyltransferase RsmD
VRVAAGTLKGRRLLVPRGATTRPTADQVRIALLDSLTPWLPGARVLDLFAGAGSVGLEALSRGAGHATFVERDARAVAALRANVAALGLQGWARVHRGDVGPTLDRLAAAGERFMIVFLDPPYEADLVGRTLDRLATGGLVEAAGVVIAQHFTKRPPPSAVGDLGAVRTRRFGETTLTFFRRGGYPSGAHRSPGPDPDPESNPGPD